ncbi:hypothetical protein VTJ83DRAFT_7234 [Remersonia thermophila]|uniref:Uncharacterized protein n=1 Tax=Remersonia thermophila TaxID=72144 RepID=A0ABR4D3Y2_9PEZI
MLVSPQPPSRPMFGSLPPLAALAAALAAALYPGDFSNRSPMATLLATTLAITCPAYRSFSHLVYWLPTWCVLALPLTALAIALVCWLFVTLRCPAWHAWDGPGKVLLFPSQVTHSRRSPKQHSFTYSYLLVGIPVGFQGTAGGLVSVDTDGNQQSPGRSSRWPFSLAKQTAWYAINAADYLQRGHAATPGLRGKLDRYLYGEGVDPAEYPHAYLITVPRALGCHFNPVSFWYLYDVGQQLKAMILEVNNTFDERRMYFLKKTSQNSNGHTVFAQAFLKDMHISPFNPRSGIFHLSTADPLSSTTQGTTQLDVTIALYPTRAAAERDRPKLIANLTSLPGSSRGIDPCAMTLAQKLRFLAGWWWVTLATYPRILLQAAVLWLRKGLKVWTKPEPLEGTLPRRPTQMERELEGVFRRWLRFVVEGAKTKGGVEVRYRPAEGIETPAGGGVVFRTPEARAWVGGGGGEREGDMMERVEVRVLTPAFYANFVSYASVGEALAREVCDKRTIAVSRPVLFG